MWWGPQLIQLYNEASKPLFNGRHTAALGRPAHESWIEAWPLIEPAVDHVLETGKAAVARAVAVAPGSGDGTAATHLDFYYNAIHGDQGNVAGVYVVTAENFERTNHGALHEKMLDAAVRLTGSDFASLQLLDPQREELRLIAHRGFPADAAAFWDRVRVESGTTCGKALERHRRVVVADVEQADFIRGRSTCACFSTRAFVRCKPRRSSRATSDLSGRCRRTGAGPTCRSRSSWSDSTSWPDTWPTSSSGPAIRSRREGRSSGLAHQALLAQPGDGGRDRFSRAAERTCRVRAAPFPLSMNQ